MDVTFILENITVLYNTRHSDFADIGGHAFHKTLRQQFKYLIFNIERKRQRRKNM